MCGIFGVVIKDSSSISPLARMALAKDLFLISELRGKEASGFTIANNEKLELYKIASPASKMWHEKGKELFTNASNGKEPFVFVGHTRLATNGALDDNSNNQPVRVGDTVGVHNGIIVNDDLLWSTHSEFNRNTAVDTEVLISLIEYYRNESSIVSAVGRAYKEINGTASIALLFRDYDALLLGTNNGSLYTYHNEEREVFVFASEYRILEKVLAKHFKESAIPVKLPANSGLIVDFLQTKAHPFILGKSNDVNIPARKELREFQDFSKYTTSVRTGVFVGNETFTKAEAAFVNAKEEIAKLKRCTRCVLPKTFPLIQFDADGVCNYCKYYIPMKVDVNGPNALRQKILTSRKGERATRVGADLIMGFSGGRDSSYGLHFLKKELGLHPVAYTYDWGMVTDLGRRNQSRLCGKLGIEHIIVSANIPRKRDNIRKNILAWLKKPDLGLVPLFMAGDKQYFHFLNELASDLDFEAMLLCENPLERTHFKQGFCGITHADSDIPPYQFSVGDKIKIAAYYGRNFIKNPAYLNSSVLDTAGAYFSYYFISHNYNYFFDFIRWDEMTIDKVLLEEYDWELAPDTCSTWRIGDGTTPFYNYIYYMVAGFTENDTFRSNQIREGMITRNEALRLAERDNQPRWESMRWYFEAVGLDMEMALKRISEMPKLYDGE